MDKHEETNRRGLDFYNPDKDLNPPITIVGVGGIGSWAALTLAKDGFDRLILYDDDVVEVQNVGPQLYGKYSIDLPKVVELRKLLLDQSSAIILTKQEKYRASQFPTGIVIAAVDNMKDRKMIFQTCVRGEKVLFVDCRIGGEVLRMYSVVTNNADACKRYLQNWYPDSEASDLPCTGQNTAYIGAIAGGLIGREVIKHCKRDSDLDKYSFTETIMDLQTLSIIREVTV